MTEYNVSCFVSVWFIHFSNTSLFSNVNTLTLVRNSVPSFRTDMVACYAVEYHCVERVVKGKHDIEQLTKLVDEGGSKNITCRQNCGTCGCDIEQSSLKVKTRMV